MKGGRALFTALQTTGLKTSPYTNTKMPGFPVRTGTQKPRKPGRYIKVQKPESGEAADAFVLRGREAYEAAVKHLQGTAQIAVVDGAGLCAFELKDLPTGGFCYGTPPECDEEGAFLEG